MWYQHKMEEYSAIEKNKIIPFAGMDLKIVILNGVRERTTHMVTYMWNLKKGYKWTYLQNKNRVTGVEIKFMITRE